MKISTLSKKDVLSLMDLTTEEILSIIEVATRLKQEAKNGKSNVLLKGMVLGLIFQKPSTRTRVSFETGMYQLGGSVISLNTNDIQLSRGESLEDTARSLSLYLNCLVTRLYQHEEAELIAKYASIPVINGLSNLFHPCQILADLMTIQERKGKLKGVNVSWIGDGNNVCNDLILGSAKAGMNLTIACPPGYRPSKEVLAIANLEGSRSGSKLVVTDEPPVAIANADVVVTDTFVSIGNDEEKLIRERVFLPKYQINQQLMNLARKDAIFMHCLPAKRGQEVTSDVLDGKASVVWDEAENRLHSQKALLLLLTGAKQGA
jgi:ornithine carbamoyltransferase